MPTVHTFGPFRLDATAEILFREAEPVALGHRAVALLRVLVEQAGKPVSKDALIQAAWPGLAVEDSNLTVQIAALRRVLGEAPGGEAWIETLPRRGYRFIGPAVAARAGSTEPVATTEPSLTPPDIPSIAVLPFENLSGDPEQEYFADGIVEEIITALSRFRHLFVIARNSSFTYKGRVVDVQQIGHELGVRYVLEGSLRKAGSRVRIGGQLIDAMTRTNIWADHFEGQLDDIFELQDRITANVVGIVGPTLERAEIDRAKLKATESLSAYDTFLRGMAYFHQRTKGANDEACRLFLRALDLDPDYAAASGMAAWCSVWRKLNGWLTDGVRETTDAERLARHAVEMGKNDAVALSRGGHALSLLVGDLDAGVAAIDRALRVNPNLATAWYLSGWVRIFIGEPERAIEHEARAMRLSPLDTFLYNMQGGTAFAHFFAGRYEEASSWAEKAFHDQPQYAPVIRIAAASCALAGRMTEATRFMERARALDPKLRISNLHNLYPLRRPTDRSTWESGLRKAGLPE